MKSINYSLYYTFTLCLLSSNLLGQNFEVEISKDKPEINFQYTDLAVSNEMDEFYVLSLNRKLTGLSYSLTTYYANLSQNSNQPDFIPKIKDNQTTIDLISIGDNTYLLSSYSLLSVLVSGPVSYPIFCLQKIEANGNLQAKKTKLTQEGKGPRYPLHQEKVIGSPSFFYSISPDKSKFAIAIRHQNIDKKQSKLHVKIYDSNLSLLNNDSLITDNIQVYKDLLVDDEGQCYLTTQAYEIPRPAKTCMLSNIFAVTIFGNTKPEQIKIDLKDDLVTNLDTKFLINGDIQLAGFYYNKNIGGVGVFRYVLNPKTLTERKNHHQGITFEHLLNEAEPWHYKWYNKQSKKGNTPYLYDITLKEILDKEDGGTIIIGEVVDERAGTHISDDINSVPNPSLKINDLHIFNLNQQGQLIWSTKVRKKSDDRSTVAKMGGSIIFQDSTNIYVIYNDNPKNMDWTWDESKIAKYNPTEIKTSRLFVTTINKGSGEKTKSLLLKNGKSGELIDMHTVVKSSDNQYWFLGYDSYLSKKIMKITLK